MNVSRTKIYLDISILVATNMDRRKYVVIHEQERRRILQVKMNMLYHRKLCGNEQQRDVDTRPC
jgi:hypothetical protein